MLLALLAQVVTLDAKELVAGGVGLVTATGAAVAGAIKLVYMFKGKREAKQRGYREPIHPDAVEPPAACMMTRDILSRIDTTTSENGRNIVALGEMMKEALKPVAELAEEIKIERLARERMEGHHRS